MHLNQRDLHLDNGMSDPNTIPDTPSGLVNDSPRRAKPVTTTKLSATAEESPEGLSFDTSHGDSQLADVAVVFIHGIGEPKAGETLAAFGEPIIRTLRNSYRATSTALSRIVQRDEFSGWITSARLCSDSQTERRQRLLDQLEHFLALQPSARRSQLTVSDACEAIDTQSVWGSVTVRSVDAKSLHAETEPLHSFVALASIDDNAAVSSTELLFAEACWSPDIVPPSVWSLVDFLLQVGPSVPFIHAGSLIDAALREFTALHTPFTDRLRSIKSILIGGWRGLMITALVVSALIIVPFLAIVALIPIATIQDLAKRISALLTATLGDSFIFLQSPVQRARVISRIRTTVAWCAARASHVVIVAHSQGAAIAFLAFQEGFPSNVASVYAIGSGTRKLTILQALRDAPQRLAGAWVLTLLFSLAVAGIAHILGDHFWMVATLTAVAFLLALGLGSRWVVSPAVAAQVAVDLSRRPGFDWKEVYSSHDPVPNGILNPYAELAIQATIPSHRVLNRASYLTDHNTYFQNAGQVIFRLIREIQTTPGVALGYAVDLARPGLQEEIDKLCNYRVRLLWWQRSMVICILGTAFLSTDMKVEPAARGFLDLVLGNLAQMPGIREIPEYSYGIDGSESTAALGIVVSFLIMYLPAFIMWKVWTYSDIRNTLGRSKERWAVSIGHLARVGFGLWLFTTLFVVMLLALEAVSTLEFVENTWLGEAIESAGDGISEYSRVQLLIAIIALATIVSCSVYWGHRIRQLYR